MLTDKGVKAAGIGRHGDGGGLYLEVKPASRGGARKAWLLRFQVNKQRRVIGLGSYPAVSLADARAKAAEVHALIDKGIDPFEARKAAERSGRPVPTFADIAALVIDDAQARSTNAKVRYQWARHLGPAYCGTLLSKSVNEITTLDIAKVLSAVWRTKPEVARKLYPAIRRVFDRARVILRDQHGIELSRNPADWSDLKAMGFERPRLLSRGRQPSLPYAQIPEFMAGLRSRAGTAARALEFLILTGVRTDAVLKAKWDQLDLERGVWTIPLSSLKDRAHRSEGFRVPLSAPALEIVRKMARSRIGDFIFPGQEAWRQPLVQYGAADAVATYECRLCAAVDGSRHRQADHGSWGPSDAEDLGGRDRDRPSRRRRDGAGSRCRECCRTRVSQDGSARHAPEAHGRLGHPLPEPSGGRRQAVTPLRRKT